MYNKYEQPGNTWDLRVRVEKGPPEAPQIFTATGISDTQIRLSGSPGRSKTARDTFWRGRSRIPTEHGPTLGPQ